MTPVTWSCSWPQSIWDGWCSAPEPGGYTPFSDIAMPRKWKATSDLPFQGYKMLNHKVPNSTAAVIRQVTKDAYITCTSSTSSDKQAWIYWLTLLQQLLRLLVKMVTFVSYQSVFTWNTCADPFLLGSGAFELTQSSTPFCAWDLEKSSYSLIYKKLQIL